MERRRQWVPRGRPCHGKTARTIMGCSCRWDNKVTTCSRTEVATSRIGRDWLAVIREVLWRQVVRTLEHNQTPFKLDTLVDWQPVKECQQTNNNQVFKKPHRLWLNQNYKWNGYSEKDITYGIIIMLCCFIKNYTNLWQAFHSKCSSSWKMTGEVCFQQHRVKYKAKYDK